MVAFPHLKLMFCNCMPFALFKDDNVTIGNKNLLSFFFQSGIIFFVIQMSSLTS